MRGLIRRLAWAYVLVKYRRVAVKAWREAGSPQRLWIRGIERAATRWRAAMQVVDLGPWKQAVLPYDDDDE